MKWKEPTFGATPMLKALTAASARKKAKSFDLVAEQKKQKLTYPDWAQDWMRKYKEAWYIAKANGDEVGMRKAQKLAEGLRSKLREMANMPKWAQEQMKKQTLLWMEGQATGNIRQMKAAEQAGKGIREKLDLIRTIAKTSKADADKLNELTAKWYAAHDHGLVDGKDLSKDPKAVKAAKDKYSQEAQAIIGKYQKPVAPVEEKPSKDDTPKVTPPKVTPTVPEQGDKSSFGSVSAFKAKYGDLMNQLGKELSVDPNLLGAVVLVESGGSGFVNGKLKIRFEVHHFVDSPTSQFTYGSPKYKGHKYRKSSSENWKSVHENQTSEYAALDLAKSQNEERAYKSISMGLCQILGSNYKATGYSSAKEMFLKFSTGNEEQIKGFVNFLKNDGNGNKIKYLQKEDLRSFVSSYNGPGKVDDYTEKLKKNTKLYKNS
ncbi:N-acetylmuramidase domain-containing protein [Paenibacillus massiliensis]|uniref:N-acetylmuramidase domain-containing protein n=1 Tax=Paenibacillus massiliensis TaxID=225917 RepID=UPI000372D0DB|nr:N-acetylmuramidase domain-containing protein [Paenibacillus massiliensis]